MNNEGSIVEFFYNIVPGIVLLFFLQNVYKIDIPLYLLSGVKPDPALSLFIYIILGLFLGFVLQSTTKYLRKCFQLNTAITKKVILSNKQEYQKICEYIYYPKKTPADYDHDDVYTIFLMDNYLRGDHAAFLPTHFSSRFAFWSNIFSAAVLLLLINLGWPKMNNLFLFGSLFISGFISYEYYFAYFDTILKSYYMRIVLKTTVIPQKTVR